MAVTPDELKAAVAMTAAVAETIKTLGSVPSGHLYAQLMDRMSLETFESLIGILKRAKLVEENNHLLTWVGPTT